MNKARPVLRIIASVLGILILIYQAYYGYKAIQSQEVQILSYGHFGLAIISIMIAIGLNYCAWTVLMSGFQVKIPFLTGFRGFTLSYIARYIPGSIWGYLNRNEWLATEYQVPHQISVPGSVYEIGISIIASFTIIVIQKIFDTIILKRKILYIILLLIIFLIFWIFVKYLPKSKIVTHWLPEGENLLLNYPWQKWLITLTLLVGNWLWYGLMVYLCLKAFGVSTSSLFYGGVIIQLSGVFSMSWLAGFIIIFLPSGLGIREITMAALLPTAITISHSQAVAVSVATRLITLLAELIFVAFFLLSSLGKTAHHK